MDLWIRSQDKKILEKCEDLFSAYYSSKKSYAICSHKNMVTLGCYKTEKRALEILDEIQSKIKQQFICKIHPMVNSSDAKRIKEELTKEYIGDFILETPTMDIQPINSQILIYEMPEK